MANKYFIVPSPPTPNGRLHLGHIAGVYLPLDIFTRVLRQHGQIVFFMGSTDAYDSYVSLLHEDGHECNQRALELHADIVDDLKIISIEMDAFVSPLDFEYQELYVETQTKVFSTLEALGKIQLISESYLEELETGCICSGRRLGGNCPRCHSRVCGFICEGCGSINSPEHLINPFAVNGNSTHERQHVSRFLKLSCDTRDYLKVRIIEHFAHSEVSDTPLWFLAKQDSLIRMTSAGDYGLTLAGFSVTEKVFNYTGFADYVFSGELYKKLTGDHVNPFERGADFSTIGMCGPDNALSSLVFESAVAQESLIWNCIDNPIISGFLTFEGLKFSTSRRHGIWGHELLACSKVDRDILRYYLATICPEAGSRNFSVEQYLKFNNVGAGRNIYNSIQRARECIMASGVAISAQACCPPNLSEFFLIPWRDIGVYGLSVSLVVERIDRWVAQQADIMVDLQGALVYLYGLAILTYPVLPGMAEILWVSLGLIGLPRFTQPLPSLCYHGEILSLPLLDKTDIEYAIHQSQGAK